MYPTLFTIFGFRVDTYSVVWFIALSLAIVWAIKRLELYKLDEDEARTIMSVSFFCMLLGARSPEYFANWKMYLDKPSLLLDLNRGGVHEVGAITGAFLGAFVISMFRRKISFLKLCEAVAIPAVLAIAVGRWGCFLNGCCLGLHTNFFTAVHFPRDAEGFLRHPVQVYYSIAAFVIVFVLLFVEKKFTRYKSHSVIAPLALILYTLMRFTLDSTRVRASFLFRLKHFWNYKLLAYALLLELLWLAYGVYINSRSKSKLVKISQ